MLACLRVTAWNACEWLHIKKWRRSQGGTLAPSLFAAGARTCINELNWTYDAESTTLGLPIYDAILTQRLPCQDYNSHICHPRTDWMSECYWKIFHVILCIVTSIISIYALLSKLWSTGLWISVNENQWILCNRTLRSSMFFFCTNPNWNSSPIVSPKNEKRVRES